MCMIDGAEGCVTVLLARHQKANKDHRCAECFRTIRKGEKYLNERYVWEGSATTHKTCKHCQVVRDWLQGECGGFLYGGIEEDICEHGWENYYGVGVKMLAVGMRRKWTTKSGHLWRTPTLPNLSRPQAQTP